MMLGSRLIKFFKRLLALAIALPAAFYLVLLVVNWSDRPPSAAALRFQKVIDSRPQIADSDNAYIYANGFDVAPDLDPAEWGRARFEWADAIAGHSSPGAYDNPPGEKSNFRAQRSERIQTLASTCHRKPGAECYAALGNGGELPEQWLLRESWVLERYRTLISLPAWREQIPGDITAPFPPYGELLEGQKLLFLKVWQLAGSGDAAGVRDLLQEDIRFWRMVLASADTLLMKMIATEAIDRHFSWSNLAFRQLPAERVVQAVPNPWQQPLTELELSLERCFAGEWLFSNNIVTGMKGSEEYSLAYVLSDFSEDGLAPEGGPFSRILTLLSDPMLQPQDSSNRHAEALLAFSETMQVPFEEFSEALQRVKEMADTATDTNIGLYNPLGTVLLRVGYSTYANYPPRIADLEGQRRAVLLGAQLRGQGVAPNKDQMQRLLDESDLRTPYTGEPFAWDEESGVIVFAGLESGERGQHAFLY